MWDMTEGQVSRMMLSLDAEQPTGWCDHHPRCPWRQTGQVWAVYQEWGVSPGKDFEDATMPSAVTRACQLKIETGRPRPTEAP